MIVFRRAIGMWLRLAVVHSVILMDAIGRISRQNGLDDVSMDENRQDTRSSASSFVGHRTCYTTPSDVDRCECMTINSTGLMLNCSGLQIRTVPLHIPVNTVILILSNNNISNITESPFSNLTNLMQLDLSTNRITEFRNGAFNGLMNLLSLDLHDNMYPLLPNAFDDDVFEPLSNLKELNIKTSFSSEEFSYPDNVLRYLYSLNTLRIDGLSNKTFGYGVHNMSSLETLDLSRSPNFEHLSGETFVNFPNIPLQTLLLNDCSLQWISQDAFVYLQHIDTIDFSNNVYLKVRGVDQSFKGLQNKPIRKVFMRHVESDRHFVSIRKEDLKYIKRTRLEELHLDNNTIVDIDTDAIRSFPTTIKVFSASHNILQTNKWQVETIGMYFLNLTEINVSYQQTHSPRQNSENTSYKNSLFDADKTVFLPSTDITEDHFTISVPPNLHKVECSNTYKIKFEIPTITFLNSSGSYLDLSNNLLSSWKGTIKGLETLQYLDLSGNQCDYVSDNFFHNFSRLDTLLIGNNAFGPDIPEVLFFNLTDLKVLDISRNRIENAKFGLFSNLTSLEILNMSLNYLSSWEASMSDLVNIRLIDLSWNKFTSLAQNLRKDVDSIQKRRPLKVDLSHNPFICDCNTEDFVSWMATTKVRFLDINSTKCKLPNGTRLSLKIASQIKQYLQIHCRSYTVLISVLSSVFGLSVVVLTGVLIRKNRWRIRYWFYMKFNRRERTGYQRLEGNDVENAFAFDAFISYEDNSRGFLLREIIPRLETEANLKLCIDKRDFIPGLYVEDNIMNAIQNSRKTVALLTNEFLKSKWCMYELNMARMEGIQSGRQNLIVVLMEDICTENFSREVLNVFRRHTYIEQTEDGFGTKLYWNRLIDSINEDKLYNVCIN